MLLADTLGSRNTNWAALFFIFFKDGEEHLYRLVVRLWEVSVGTLRGSNKLEQVRTGFKFAKGIGLITKPESAGEEEHSTLLLA